MIAQHLPDDRLALADVPAEGAPLPDLVAFGHRYHAYKVAGSLPRVAEVALTLHDRWAAGEGLDDAPLARLRIALFHTVRALDHDPSGTEDGAGDERWVRALVAAVRARLDDADPR